MTKEHYFMNFTKEQLAVKLEELDKKYQRDEILAKKPAQELEKECATA